MTLDSRELRRRLIALEDITDDELASLDARTLALARTVRSAAQLRRAVEALVDACVLDDFKDQATLDLMLRASREANYEYGIPAAFKALGLQAVQRRDYVEAMRLFEIAVTEGNRIGSRPDLRSRACFAYWHDREIDRAYEVIGQDIPAPRLKTDVSARTRLAIIASSLSIDAATTMLVERLTELCSEHGAGVVVISTEFGSSGDSPAIARIEQCGAEVFRPVPDTQLGRLEQIVQYVDRNPIDVGVWYAWQLDSVAKVASVVRLAPRQVFINNTCEQMCGEFDLVLYCASPRELESGTMRGERRFIGTPAAARERIESAEPFSREQFGLTDKNVVLGTYGRISKCCDWDYVRSLARILRSAPDARLIVAGYGDPQSDPLIRELFDCEGVTDQVLFPGNFPGAYYGIYKITDVYCDTFFWRGGQSVLEAMVAAVPVVAIRSNPDPILDPTGAGCMSNSADLLGSNVPIAPPGDHDEYVRIALRYINDPDLRRRAGAALRSHAQQYDAKSTFNRFIDALESRGLLPNR